MSGPLAPDGASAELASRYDLVSYPSRAFPVHHPNRLAATARLLGLSPAPIARCRVLEVGCSDGAHLIPLAAALPQASFLGIDVAAARIGTAAAQIAALGLHNVRVQARGLEELGDGEPFDYVIAHGVYSWVPPAVADQLLSLCRRRLAPDGLALISYNALPGWYLRGLGRGVMLRLGGDAGAGSVNAEAAEERAAGAPLARNASEECRRSRAALAWLAANVPPGAAHAGILATELRVAEAVPDEYLFHDQLAPHNEPCWFLDFVARAAGHGLAYAGEARVADMAPERFPPATRQALAAATSDPLLAEQLMDALLPRNFRRTLLCHRERTPRLAVDRSALRTLCFALPEGIPADRRWEWVEDAEAGAPAATLAARARTALGAEAPQSVAFASLRTALASHLPAGEPGDDALAHQLLRALVRGAIEVSSEPWPLVATVPRFPLASPLARRQAAAGIPSVTNLRHEPVTVDADDRLLLAHLDGTRDHAALAAATGGPQRDIPWVQARLKRLATLALLATT